MNGSFDLLTSKEGFSGSVVGGIILGINAENSPEHLMRFFRGLIIMGIMVLS